MPPQSPLVIATGVVQRLVKEEASYHRELESQQKRIEKLEAETASGQPDEDGNREYILNQEVRTEPKKKALQRLDGQIPNITKLQRQALEETRRVLPSMKKKISEAVARLDGLLVSYYLPTWRILMLMLI
jgi:tubulin-specific chaperone A